MIIQKNSNTLTQKKALAAHSIISPEQNLDATLIDENRYLISSIISNLNELDTHFLKCVLAYTNALCH